jgi:starch synthase
VKVGGLGDVSGSLPLALSDLGCHVKLFLPLYKIIDKAANNIRKIQELDKIHLQLAGKKYVFDVWYAKLKDFLVEVYLIDCPEFYDRDDVYTTDPDEDLRFIFFQNAVLLILQKLHWHLDVIHCNDWQSGLIPAYTKRQFAGDKLFSKSKTLLSIHNIAYQGSFPADSALNAGFSLKDIKDGSSFELYKKFNFLKTGISFSDVLTTVSPTYALETQTEEFGCGLEKSLSGKKNSYYGILNGIDTGIWNPGIDKEILANYDFDSFERKKFNKIRLLKELNLPYDENRILIGNVSRLAYQKGFDIIIPALDEILKMNVQLIILGEGEAQYEKKLKEFSEKYPDKFYIHVGYDNRLSHLITAGSDMFLMPSRYEPCGLNQMYSLNYGTIPIVRKTGGLADTIKDIDQYPSEGNGITFDEYSPEALLNTIKKAIEIYSNKELRFKIIQRGMSEDFSWKKSAKKYLEIYEKVRTV